MNLGKVIVKLRYLHLSERLGREAGKENDIMETEESYLGRIAYEAYCETTGWKSAITGADLPQFYSTPLAVQTGWIAAAQAVKKIVNMSNIADKTPDAPNPEPTKGDQKFMCPQCKGTGLFLGELCPRCLGIILSIQE